MTKVCIDCGRSREEVPINHKGRCPDCAFKKCLDAATQMHNKEGPYYERWKIGMKLFFQDHTGERL